MGSHSHPPWRQILPALCHLDGGGESQLPVPHPTTMRPSWRPIGCPRLEGPGEYLLFAELDGCHRSGDRSTSWGHCSRRSRRTLLAFVCEDHSPTEHSPPGRANIRAATSGFRIRPSRTSAAHKLTMTSALTWSTLSSLPAGGSHRGPATSRTAHLARNPTPDMVHAAPLTLAGRWWSSRASRRWSS